MSEVIIFTDGSTLNNQIKGNRKGGVGVFFGDNDERNISLALKESDGNKVTNQVAELLACIKGIEKILLEDTYHEVWWSANNNGLLGFSIFKPCKDVIKYGTQINDPNQIRFELEKAIYIANSGRKGPVIIDIPDNIQRENIN